MNALDRYMKVRRNMLDKDGDLRRLMRWWRNSKGEEGSTYYDVKALMAMTPEQRELRRAYLTFRQYCRREELL